MGRDETQIGEGVQVGLLEPVVLDSIENDVTKVHWTEV